MYRDDSTESTPKRYLERRYKKMADKPFDWFSEYVSIFLAPEKKEDDILKLRLQFMNGPFTRNVKYLEFVKLGLLLRPNVSVHALTLQIKKVIPSLNFVIRNQVAQMESRNSKTQIHYEPGCYLGIYFQFIQDNKLLEYHFTWNYKNSLAHDRPIWCFSMGIMGQDVERLSKAFLLSNGGGLSYIPSIGLIVNSLPELQLQSISAQLYEEFDMAFSNLSMNICHCFNGKQQVLECISGTLNGEKFYMSSTISGYKHLFEHMQLEDFERLSGGATPAFETGSFRKGVFLSGLTVTDRNASVPYQVYVRQKYPRPHNEAMGHEMHIKLDADMKKVERVLLNFGILGPAYLHEGVSFCFIGPGRMEVYDGIFGPLGLVRGTKTVFLSVEEMHSGVLKDASPPDSQASHPAVVVLDAVRYFSILRTLQVPSLFSQWFSQPLDCQRMVIGGRRLVSNLATASANENVVFCTPLELDPEFNPAFNSMVLNNVRRIIHRQMVLSEMAVLQQKVIDEKQTIQRDYETRLQEYQQQWPPNSLLLERHHIMRTMIDERNRYFHLFVRFHEERLMMQQAEEAKRMVNEYTAALAAPALTFQFVRHVLCEKQGVQAVFCRDIQSIYAQSRREAFGIKSFNAVKRRVDGLVQGFFDERETLEQSFKNMLGLFSRSRLLERQFDMKKQTLVQQYTQPIVRASVNYTRYRTEEVIPGYTGEALFNFGTVIRRQAQEYASHLMIPCVSNDNQPILPSLMEVIRFGGEVVGCGSGFRGSKLANDLDFKVFAPATATPSEINRIFSIFKHMIINATKMTGLPEVGRIVLEFAGPRELPINVVICFFDNENCFPSLYTNDVITRIGADGMLTFYRQGTRNELDIITLAKTILTQEISPRRNNISGVLRVLRDVAAMPEKEFYNQKTLREYFKAMCDNREHKLLKREINVFLNGDPARNIQPKVRPEISARFKSLLSSYFPGWETIELSPDTPPLTRPSSSTVKRFGVARQIELLVKTTSKAERSALLDAFQSEGTDSALGMSY